MLDCHKVPGWDTKDCCKACHEDEQYIDGDILETIAGETHVCCHCYLYGAITVARADWERGKEAVRRLDAQNEALCEVWENHGEDRLDAG